MKVLPPDTSMIACHECGQLQRVIRTSEPGVARCGRCGAFLSRHRKNSLDRSLALSVAGLVLFVIANSFPFLGFQMQGQLAQTTLFTGVRELFAEGRWDLASVVFLTSILVPGLQIAVMLYILLPLHLGRTPCCLSAVSRFLVRLAPWGMMDVFLLGILVSVVKLSDMATIVPGIALWSFGFLIFVLAAASAAFDPQLVWDQIRRQAVAAAPGGRGSLVSCEVCNLLVRLPRTLRQSAACPRCGATLHRRKPDSIARTWALVIAAVIFYVPANLLPIMTVTSFGKQETNTIMSGVIFLLQHGMWPIALVIFVASVVVPLMKLIILAYLLLSVQFRMHGRKRERTRLYRMTEAVGRWSMVDIYVVTVLVALVQLGNVATIEADLGAVFFAAVVVITIFAAMSFDPRLIWDEMEEQHD